MGGGPHDLKNTNKDTQDVEAEYHGRFSVLTIPNACPNAALCKPKNAFEFDYKVNNA